MTFAWPDGILSEEYYIFKEDPMKKILITGGTIFVSKFTAQYFASKNYTVYVLNRNHRPQCSGVHLIECDRHNLGERLRGFHFDAILDITAYTGQDVNSLLDATDGFDSYILISSSAVYPESTLQPFQENAICGPNVFWGKYGTDKITAEQALLARVPNAYILRPPYLYGPMNNVYREAFIFDCAIANRKFFLPGHGDLKLQFFHVNDLCRFMEILLIQKPSQKIFNVGNPHSISIKEWATLCYQITGHNPEFVPVELPIEPRKYFCFYNYEYFLDVQAQHNLMPETISLEEGLRQSFAWYQQFGEEVNRKPYQEFIDNHLKPFIKQSLY